MRGIDAAVASARGRAALACLSLVACAGSDSTPLRSSVDVPTPAITATAGAGRPRPTPSVSMRIVPVLDGRKVTTTVYSPGGRPVALPRDARLEEEVAPVGPTGLEASMFVVVPVLQGETLDEALARSRAWAAALRTPPDTEVLLGPSLEADADGLSFRQVGWRTYLVAREPILTEAHVARAEARAEGGVAFVSLELTPEGAERFAAGTRAALKRRIAVVVDGHVTSAPEVEDEIPGGRCVITMGLGDLDRDLAEARRLAAALDRKER